VIKRKMHLFVISIGVMLGAIGLVGAIGYIGSEISKEITDHTKWGKVKKQGEWLRVESK
jgi:hypothetical protein